jgi:GTPase SAR1 family protein
MGLGASGKSSIQSVVFEGKSPKEVKDYQATINYTRSTKNIIDTTFQIFDCGGQESFISAFVGDQAEFIFSNVSILIWVVDLSDFDQVSTSRFYFNHALTRLSEFSPDGVVFCLLHKRDLLSPDKLDQALTTMKQYFKTDFDLQIQYHTTSIFDQSIYYTMGELIRTLIRKTEKSKTVSEAIQEFLGQNNEVSGIAIYTEDGVPVFEEGRLANRIMLHANLSLTHYERIKAEFQTSKTFKTTLETDDYFFVFQKLKNEIMFIGIAEKTEALQYITEKMNQFAKIVSKHL